MRSKLLIPGIAAILALTLCGTATAAQPAAKSPFAKAPGGECGGRITVAKGLRIIRGTAAFKHQYALHPGLHSDEARYDCKTGIDTFIFLTKKGNRVLDVELDFRTGRVAKTWEGYKASWVMTRGYGDFFGQNINRWFIWLSLCLLFVIPFVNVRRPLRLLHLDLLVLVAGFGISHYFFNRGNIDLSTPLVYPVLAYFLVRALVAGFRPRKHREPLVPHLPNAVLIAGLVLLICFRIVFNVVDSKPIDISYAGVAGADRITHGLPLYHDGGPNEYHFDTYGPVNYLAYVPVEAVLPLRPDDPAEPGIPNVNDQPAAHAATILFDLLCIVGLFMLGAVARKGAAGKRLGLALAYAWAAFPYSAFALASNTNDLLLVALVVFALVAIASPPARGFLLGLAALSKFAPLALAPLMATGRGGSDRKLEPVLIFSAVFVGTCALLLLPFVHSVDGVRTFYEQTIGFQTGRKSPMTIWGLGLAPGFLQTAAKLGVVVLGIFVAFRPKVRSTAQVAALAAALLVGLEIAGDHWFYLYIVWFAAPLLFALFSEYQTGAEQTVSDESASTTGRKRTRGDTPARAARLGSASG